ncbi:MAG: hypothetical protein AAF203_08030, partial [Pseudomonadota bacterium]
KSKKCKRSWKLAPLNDKNDKGLLVAKMDLINRIFTITIVSLVLSSAAMADSLSQLNEIFERSLSDAPKVAKLICTEKTRVHIWLFGESYNPLTMTQQYFEFREKRKEYLGDLYDLGLFDIDQEESVFVRDVSDQGYTGAVIDQAFYESLVSMFSFDMLELLHFRSFYLHGVFHSVAFAKELDRCQKFYGYEIPGMLEDIQWHANLRNRSGFIGGQIITTVIGVGAAAKIVAMLPRAGKVAFVVGSASAATWIAYSMITPAIKVAKELQEAQEKRTVVTLTDPTDVNDWGYYYNKIVMLKDAAIAFNRSESQEDIDKFSAQFKTILEELEPDTDVLEYIFKAYVDKRAEEGELSRDDQLEIDMVSFAIHQIRLMQLDRS